MAVDLLRTQFGIPAERIDVHKNLSKEEIDEKLAELKLLAAQLDQRPNRQQKESQVIAIVNIGCRIDPRQDKYVKLLRKFKIEPNSSIKEGSYEDFYELTSAGEPMNLNESATWIADTRDPLYDHPFKSSTQVILMNDTQETIDHLLPQHLEATQETFKNLEILKDNDRSSRQNVTFIPAIDLKTATAVD